MSSQPNGGRREHLTARERGAGLLLSLAGAIAIISACTSVESSITAPSASKCQVTVSNSMQAVPAAGGSGTLTIATARDCTWAASGGAAWLVITSGSNGQGDGTLAYRAAPNPDPSPRRASIEVNSETINIAQDAAECRFTVTPLTHGFGAGGGEATVQVETHASCSWSAATDATWITISAQASGRGNGSVALRIAPNTGPARSAAVVVAGVSVTISQADGTASAPPLPPTPPAPSCTYSIQPTGQTMSAAGGPGTIGVIAQANCGWTAVPNVPWITIVGTASGSGTAAVAFNVGANSGASRTGTISVAGQTFTLTQGAVACSYSISPASATIPSAGGTSTVTVSTGASCGWASASNAAWITIVNGSGTGGSAVTLNVAANTGAARTGTATIAGQTFTVTQSAAPCTFSILPTAVDSQAPGGTFDIAVTAGAGCAWTASTTDAWITITAGASGAANGTVQIAVAANSGAARSGSVTIGGQTLTVTQQAACTFALAPTSQNFAAGGGSGTVTVTAGPACGWTASSSDPQWLTITSPAAGTGNGSIAFTTAANTGAARTGILLIGGQTFTATQDAACTFSISPAGQTMSAAGGTGSFTVSAGPTCAWSASSNSTSWLTITAGGAGTGPGSVTFQASANTGPARSGIVTVAGQTFTLNQEAP
jgi:hypothetical protein